MNNKYIRKINKNHRHDGVEIGLIGIPAEIFKSWDAEGFTHVEIEFVDQKKFLVSGRKLA